MNDLSGIRRATGWGMVGGRGLTQDISMCPHVLQQTTPHINEPSPARPRSSKRRQIHLYRTVPAAKNWIVRAPRNQHRDFSWIPQLCTSVSHWTVEFPRTFLILAISCLTNTWYRDVMIILLFAITSILFCTFWSSSSIKERLSCIRSLKFSTIFSRTCDFRWTAFIDKISGTGTPEKSRWLPGNQVRKLERTSGNMEDPVEL